MPIAPSPSPTRVLVIGGGIAGQAVCEELAGKHCSLTLACGEPHLPYDRVNLGKLLSGEAGDVSELELRPQAWYDDHGIDICRDRPRELWTGRLPIALFRPRGRELLGGPGHGSMTRQSLRCFTALFAHTHPVQRMLQLEARASPLRALGGVCRVWAASALIRLHGVPHATWRSDPITGCWGVCDPLFTER